MKLKKLKCAKCMSSVDTDNEYCPSCGAYNPYYGLTDEEASNLAGSGGSSQSQPDLWNRSTHEPEERKSHPWIKWIVTVIVLAVVGIILASSNNEFFSSAGEGMLEGVGEGVLKSLIVVIPCVIISLIIRAVSKSRENKRRQSAQQSQPPQTVSSTSNVRNSGDSGTIICQNCFRSIPAGSVFCNFCGKPVQSNEKEETGTLGKLSRINEEMHSSGIRTDSSEREDTAKIVAGTRVDLSKHTSEPEGSGSSGEDDSFARLRQIRSEYDSASAERQLRSERRNSRIKGFIAVGIVVAAIAALVIISVNSGKKKDSGLTSQHSMPESYNEVVAVLYETEDSADNDMQYDTGFEFRESSNGKYILTGYTGSDTDLVVPDTYNGGVVTKVGDYAFKDRMDITSVTFGGNMKTIGESAFEGCTSLKKVVFEDCGDSSRESGLIMEKAFYGCSSLETVEMPDYTMSIGYRGFVNCSSLRSIDLLNIDQIGERAFRNCTSLNSLNINCKTLGKYAFFGCLNLSYVNLSTDKVPDSCFESCTSLFDFVGRNITSIGSMAFAYCYSLTKVDLTGSPKVLIAEDAFEMSGYTPPASKKAEQYSGIELCQMTYAEITDLLGMPDEYFWGKAYFYTDTNTYVVGFYMSGDISTSSDGYDPYSYGIIPYITIYGGSETKITGDTCLGGDLAYYDERLSFDAYDALRMGAGDHGASWYELSVRYTAYNGDEFNVVYMFDTYDVTCFAAKVEYLRPLSM